MKEFSLKQVNRFYLKSHFLFKKAQKDKILKVISAICGLNSQTARAPYISLWNRVKGFKKEMLKKLLFRDRLLVKTWLMRGTVHTVSIEDFPIYQKALRSNLLKNWEKTLKKLGFDLPNTRRKKLHQRILKLLSNGAFTKRELMPYVKDIMTGYKEREEKILLSRELRTLSYQGLILHGEPTGPWYHFKENRFTSVDYWLPEMDLNKLDENEAKANLLLSYLHSYGPVSIQDFAYWTGFNVSEAKDVFQIIKSKIKEIKINGVELRYWMLKEDIGSLDVTNIKDEAPPHFLPEFDPIIMGHRDKSRILERIHKKKIFLPLADVAPTVLLEGYVRGIWNFKIKDEAISISLFESVPLKVENSVENESKKLYQFFKEG